MAGLLVSVILAAALAGSLWNLARVRTTRRPGRPLPGQLSAAERRRLYKRLGINPALLARQQRSNVIWLDPAPPRTRV